MFSLVAIAMGRVAEDSSFAEKAWRILSAAIGNQQLSEINDLTCRGASIGLVTLVCMSASFLVLATFIFGIR